MTVRRSLTVLVAAVGFVVGACGGGSNGSSGGATTTTEAGPPLPPLSATADCTEDSKHDGGDKVKHVDDAGYDVDPPAGGDHENRATLPGIYKTPPRDGELVHGLEHGDIVVWHKPNIAAGDFDTLAKLARDYPRHVILVPRSSMDVPVAATAWEKRLLCNGLDVKVLGEWIEDNRNKGPEGFVD